MTDPNDINEALGMRRRSPARRFQQGNDEPTGDFWAFRRMITPVIIQVLFWILVAASLVGGCYMLAGDPTMSMFGWLVILLGSIVARVVCEVLIVIFRINETLTDIRAELIHASKVPVARMDE